MRNQRYKFFTRRIHRLARKRRFPVNTMFELTYRCNFKCVHCYVTKEQKTSMVKDELKTKDVFNVLAQLKEMGCFYLGFTGGEIFTRADIFDILWYARRLGLELILLTNGSLIDKKAADELKRISPNKVDITVDAVDEDVFEKITRTPRSCERVFNAIELLRERNIAVCLKTSAMTINENEIPKIGGFAKRLNLPQRISYEMIPRLDRTKAPLEYSLSASRWEKVSPRKRSRDRLFKCDAGYWHVTINPYGELKICIEIEYPKYKILDGSLKEGWGMIKGYIDSLTPPQDWACKSCDLAEYCFSCPGNAYLEEGSFFTCPAYIRKKAEDMRWVIQKRGGAYVKEAKI